MTRSPSVDRKRGKLQALIKCPNQSSTYCHECFHVECLDFEDGEFDRFLELQDHQHDQLPGRVSIELVPIERVEEKCCVLSLWITKSHENPIVFKVSLPC
jgi:hypothetical protein